MGEHQVTGPRRVLVLGADPRVDLEALFSEAVANGSSVVFLTVGYPVTSRQQHLVASATERAMDASVRFDAVLVPGSEELGGHLRASDQVEVVASGWQRRRLQAAIGRRPSDLSS